MGGRCPWYGYDAGGRGAIPDGPMPGWACCGDCCWGG